MAMYDKTVTVFHAGTAATYRNCCICPYEGVTQTERGRKSSGSVLLSIPKVALSLDPGVDFFIMGEYDGAVTDDLYEDLNSAHKGVYLISAATDYSVIPHTEVIGR